jgi:hypothetical protein
MSIACLGWGSLIWDPRTLPVRSPWNRDGPWLRVEYARQSSKSVVSLVLEPDAQSVQVLWTLLEVAGLPEAREALRLREGTGSKYIGYWSAADRTEGEVSRLIGSWATQQNLEGVVWTALPPRWNDQVGVVPTVEQVLERLRECGTGSNAERYVRRTPPQVRTAYRARIEAELGWTHSE